MKKQFKKVVSRVCYTIYLTVDEMTMVLESENDCLDIELYNIEGISNVDYDGMYGPNIFLDVDAKFDTPDTWEKIDKIIGKYTNEK